LALRQEFNPWGVRIEGHELPSSGSEGDTSIQWVNPQFLHTLRLRLASGRFFEERDKADAPMAAVVNETFARTFFPNEDPIGKQVTVWFAKTTIIGVVADFKLNSLVHPGRTQFAYGRSTSTRGRLRIHEDGRSERFAQ
jgi:hypothetical protein